MSRRVVVLLAGIVCIPASRLLAQAPSFSPEFQVNTYTSVNQYFPKVAADANGNFVVVWESNLSNQDGSQGGIFAQRYDATGAAQGGEFPVNTYTTGNQSRPSVAMDPAGDFVVVWQSANQDGSNWGVFGQRFNAAGAAQGSEFQANTYTTGSQYAPSVAMDSTGNFVVAWQSYGQDGSGYGITAQRFNSAGAKQGGELLVNAYTTGFQANPSVAMDPAGDFVIAWDGGVQGPGGGGGAYGGIGAQRFDSAGVPQGGEIVLDYYNGSRPSVALDSAGNFVVVWTSLLSNIYGQRFDNAGNAQGLSFQVSGPPQYANTSPSVAMDSTGSFIVVWKNSGNISGQRFDAGGFLVGSEFQINADTLNQSSHPSVALTGGGNFVVDWTTYGKDGSGYGVFARRAQGGAALPMAVDARTVSGSSSNHNGVLEAGETVQVAAGWKNTTASSVSLSGTATNIAGPPGGTYAIADDTANYGLLAVGAQNDCFDATGDCYLMTVTGARPVPHWDVTFDETLSDGFAKTWTLHVGESFADVPTTLNFYPFIENIFHNGITGGCGAGYCPTTAVNRGQMAVFLLKAKHGSLYVPPPCTGIFPDVSCGSPFAPWIEQLFHEGITGGCGGGNYCPNNPVTRAQMAVFLLKSEHGSTYVPPACHGIFGDVTCPSTFADWIEQLFTEGVTGGCGGGNYCPGNPNTRGQMAVFLVKTFGLQLYGP
ncbi:MAG: S-layer homology domain-containing protein [Acidobacteriota bacterium]